MAATSSADTRENVSDSETWYQQKKCKPATLFFFIKDLAWCLNLLVVAESGNQQRDPGAGKDDI